MKHTPDRLPAGSGAGGFDTGGGRGQVAEQIVALPLVAVPPPEV